MTISTYQNLFDAFFQPLIEAFNNQPRDRSPSPIDPKDLDQFEQWVRENSKKMSQVIAKSWLRNDPEGAQIRQVILSGDTDQIKDFLKTKYNVEIESVLGPLIGSPVKINVDWDTFGGRTFEFPSGGIYVLPYPPRPAEVTDTQLQKWIDDNDPSHQFPADPYIPLTQC
ncbi:MAG: hypothetical protein PUP93_15015 [Rhizonema sp. NSF051]|nr:hypothetical protein [Rhizonema sp. NSF051]